MSPIDTTKRPAGGDESRPGGKVSLTKRGQGISLQKGGSAQISINLNWAQSAGGGGGLFRKSKSVDLDLGCLYELQSGRKGAVQALGNSFGSYETEPYVRLDKDDRSGSSTDGEFLFLNPGHARDVKRLLVYAFIYEGAASWDQANGVVTVKQEGGPTVEVRLDEHSGQKMCAIALIESTGDGFQISRQVRYFNGHRDMDEGFSWGLNWQSGSK